MLNIDFKINEKILILNIIRRKMNKEYNELEILKDKLWKKYNQVYKELQEKVNNIDFSNLNNDKYKDFFNEFIQTKIYKQLYKETKDYKEILEKNWNNNKILINNYLNDILKIKIDINITNYVTHPNSHPGYKIDSNSICYSNYHGIDNPYYDLRYLVHESLHCILPYKENMTNVEIEIQHDIIKLVDKEIYQRLIDSNANDLEDKFKIYLKDKNKDILDFIKEQLFNK